MESASKLNHDPLQPPKHLFPPTIIHHFKGLTLTSLPLIISILSFFLLPLPLSSLLLLVLHFLCKYCSPQVYMVDFSCYRPPDYCRVPRSAFIEHVSLLGIFDKESVEFMERALGSSGQGERTCLPPALSFIPPRPYHKESIEEVQMVLFPVMESLLCKAKMSPKEVDILIVNCSGLCPSPSLCSIVVNRFKMREDVKSFTLSGMGCSASVIAVDMAASLLKVHKNSNAIILSTEILTTGWYTGKERSKLVLNCVFRMGSAAILLTNRKQAKGTSKYKLVQSLRTQRASEDMAYRSAFREEDHQGITGVTLTREILQVAGEVIRSIITDLGFLILPMAEKFKYVTSLAKVRLFKGGKERVYVPNFKTVIEHFCLPTSGRLLIRELARGLSLEEKDTEAAIATLHRFGNQSSSSLWYELAYLEAKGRVKEGDKVWQLGMGSGVKSASVVWECVGPILGQPKMGPWADCIDKYPKLAFDFD